MPVNLGQFIRPRTVTIFAVPPGTPRKIFVAIVLTQTRFPTNRQVTLDLSSRRTTTHEYRWTQSPVEQSVSDNVIVVPPVFTVEGTLSATPLGLTAQFSGAFGSLARFDIRKKNILLDIAAKREPVMVVTPENTYPSLGIQNITEIEGDGNKIDLSLTFRTVTIVPVGAVVGEIDLDAILSDTFSESNIGSQAGSAVPGPSAVAGGGFG